MSKPWQCRLGWHKWTKRFTADNQPFLQCARCAKDNPNAPGPPPGFG
jgi:hypothetical protein